MSPSFKVMMWVRKARSTLRLGSSTSSIKAFQTAAADAVEVVVQPRPPLPVDGMANSAGFGEDLRAGGGVGFGG